MATISERLEYTTAACRKLGLAPLIWRLNGADYAKLGVTPNRAGRALHDSIPVERSQASFSSCLTRPAHGVASEKGEMLVPNEVGDPLVERSAAKRG